MEVTDQLPDRHVQTCGGLCRMSLRLEGRGGGEGEGGVSGFQGINSNALDFFA